MGIDRCIIHRDTFLSRTEIFAPTHGRSQRDAGFVFRRRTAFRRQDRRARALTRWLPRARRSSTSAANSTRPGHAPVSAEEELRRVAPVLGALAEGFRRSRLHRHRQSHGGARGGAARRLGHQRHLGIAARSRHGGRGRRNRLGGRRHAQPRAGGRDDRHSRRRRALLRTLAQSRGGRGRAVRPHFARSRRRLRQDAGAEPFLHLEPRPLPPLRRADPDRALAQVLHRPDHRRRGRQPSPRHARRKYDCAHAGRLSAQGA